MATTGKPPLKNRVLRLSAKLLSYDNPPQSTQETLPYTAMYPDGICKTQDGRYSKTIEYESINYRLASNEHKRAIFEGWCDFLNYFNSSIGCQLTFLNKRRKQADMRKNFTDKSYQHQFPGLWNEYNDFLCTQMAKGNNGLEKHRYVTFTVAEKKQAQAKAKLEQVDLAVTGNFKKLGVVSLSLDGAQRLSVLHQCMHTAETPFQFDWRDAARSGMPTQSFVAPESFDFRERKTFRMGGLGGASSYVQIQASELSEEMLAKLLDLDCEMVVNIHLQAVEQAKAIKHVHGKMSDINKMKIEQQQKANQAGYDMDIIPADLNTYGKEAERMLKDLQTRDERMFMATIIITNLAKTRAELEQNTTAVAALLQEHNCLLKPLDFQQEQAMMSSLPLGVNQLRINRALTTSSTAVFMPFTTQELLQPSSKYGGRALYYALNALSNNLIVADRLRLDNPNGLILGAPGTGKSFAAKQEMEGVILTTGDDIIVADPDGEYTSLLTTLGGQVIKISAASHQHINPMDINPHYGDSEDPIKIKSDFILSFCETILGSRDGLEPIERSIIDKCVKQVYQEFLEQYNPDNMPVLEDLYDELRKLSQPEAQRLADALEIYVHGSLNVFNHRTNVDTENRILCYNLKSLGSQLKKLGLLILQDQVWNRVTANREKGKMTWYYIDEFHQLLREPQIAAYSVDIWKRFRKYGGVPTGITQNVSDLLKSPEISEIFKNSYFIQMLPQSASDGLILAENLGISEYEMEYIKVKTASQSERKEYSEGLIYYGGVIIPFINRFPKNTQLYQLMTTKLDEVTPS